MVDNVLERRIGQKVEIAETQFGFLTAGGS